MWRRSKTGRGWELGKKLVAFDLDIFSPRFHRYLAGTVGYYYSPTKFWRLHVVVLSPVPGRFLRCASVMSCVRRLCLPNWAMLGVGPA